MSPETRLSQRAHWAGGQPISQLMHLALAHPELISLAAGFVDQQSLPAEPTQRALDAVLSDPQTARAALQYGTTMGYPPLRDAVLARFLAADRRTAAEANLSVDRVMLTAGSNQLLHLLCDALLDPGDIVLCAAPTYFVFLGMLSNVGARSVGVAADDQGMVPEALEEELALLEQAGELDRVKAIYITSYFDNPRSVTLSDERRPRIVEIAKRWSRTSQIYVIEDAAYRELRYAGEDIPSLRSYDTDGDTVVVAETFSKSFSPGIRVGWGILPRALVEPVANLKGNIDFGSPNFNQHLMAKVLELGLFEPHVESLRQRYSDKLSTMLMGADDYLSTINGLEFTRPSGGLYIWAQLPEDVDAGPNGALMDQALAEGVLYVPGQYCYPEAGEPALRNSVRLSFGVQHNANLRRGVEALGRAILATRGVDYQDLPPPADNPLVNTRED